MKQMNTTGCSIKHICVAICLAQMARSMGGLGLLRYTQHVCQIAKILASPIYI